MVHPVITQTIYYAIVMALSIGAASMILKGFFWKYVKVRLSFGKYILVKVRSPLRDYFSIGRVEDSFLVFKRRKNDIRILITDNIFYRSLAVTWVDVDEEINAACTVDYKGVTGYDAEKYDDLLTRALMKPAIKSNFEKIVIGMLLLIGVLALASVYLSYIGYDKIITLQPAINSLTNTVASNTQTIAASTGL